MKEKDFYPEITKKLEKLNTVLNTQLKDIEKFEQDYKYIKSKKRGEENENRTIEE